MASVEKFHAAAVLQELRHNHREIRNSSNPDIDPSKSAANDYSFAPDHAGLTPYQYYKQRLNELYIFDPKRKDINTAFGWVVSLPEEIVDPETEQIFFSAVRDFLLQRYGPENAVSITVHRDEGGQPHLHYIGIPAVANNMRSKEHPQPEKLSCKEVINRKELIAFHPELQQYLEEHGVPGRVHTGITAGHNRTVTELKRETIAKLRAENERLRDVEKKYEALLRERSTDREQSRWDRRDTTRERGRF